MASLSSSSATAARRSSATKAAKISAAASINAAVSAATISNEQACPLAAMSNSEEGFSKKQILFTKAHPQYGIFSNFYAPPKPLMMPMPLEPTLTTSEAKASPAAAKAVHLNVKGDSNMNLKTSHPSTASSSATQTPLILLPFPTTEHYFQAMKFPFGSRAFFACVDAPTPAAAKKAGGNRSVPIRPDWNTYRLTAMYKAVGVKFSDATLQDILCSTGDDTELVEHSVFDRFWGNGGGNGRGQNQLGKTLMRVRDEIMRFKRENNSALWVAPIDPAVEYAVAGSGAASSSVALPLTGNAGTEAKLSPPKSSPIVPVDGNVETTAVSDAELTIVKKARKVKNRLQ